MGMSFFLLFNCFTIYVTGETDPVEVLFKTELNVNKMKWDVKK